MDRKSHQLGPLSDCQKDQLFRVQHFRRDFQSVLFDCDLCAAIEDFLELEDHQ